MASIVQGRMIDAAIARLEPGSPLAGRGIAFAEASERSNVDWRLLVAIAYAETRLGTTGNAQAIHNPFGIGPGRSYPSWSDAILAAGELIRSYREDHGLVTVAEIGSRWAPVGAGNDPRNLNSNWVRNVTATMRSLGGSPDDTTLDKSGITSIPGEAVEAAEDVAGAVGEPLELIGDLAARLTDPAWWVRVGMVVSGVLGLGLGVVLIGRAVTDPDAR